jgi:hypothetical protein
MAQTDVSIYNALIKPVRSVDDYRADMDARESNALQLQSQRMQMHQAQQGMERQNALQSYLSSGNVTPEGLMRIDPKMGMELTKTQAQVAKDQASTAHSTAQTQREQIAAAKAKIDMTVNIQSAARDQASYSQGLQMLQQSGIDVSPIPPQFDPTWVQTITQQALTVKERLDAQDKAEGRRLTERGQDVTAATARRGQDITVRGQNLVDARARDANTAAAGATKGAPSGYRWTADGGLEPITGGPADPKAKAKTGNKLPAELQRMAIAMDALETGLTAYEQALKGFNPRSIDQANPEKRAAIESLVADLRMQAKEAQALGALTGPDMAILDQSLTSPGSVKGAYYGKGGLTEQVAQTRAAIKRRRDALHKQAMPGAEPEAAAATPATATTAAPDIDALLKKYGQ